MHDVCRGRDPEPQPELRRPQAPFNLLAVEEVVLPHQAGAVYEFAVDDHACAADVIDFDSAAERDEVIERLAVTDSRGASQPPVPPTTSGFNRPVGKVDRGADR